MIAYDGSFRLSSLLLQHDFAVGATRVADRYPGEEGTARIVLRATPEGGDAINMIVDTGAPWCVLDPELADAWGHVSRDSYRPAERLQVRGDSYQGRLVVVEIELHAEIGEDLAVPATIFIPELGPGQPWNLPNFIGLTGFLDRIRFAVDATENALYFGPAHS